MLPSFSVFHFVKGQVVPKGVADRGLLWETCLRHVVIVPKDSFVEGGDGSHLYTGAEAYRFLLEVITGLHSPILGETEVLGQFKNFAQRVDALPLAKELQFSKTAALLLSDAKKVRSCLKDFGSQSYGGWLRKQIQPGWRIGFLGSGQLVREMLPWVAKKAAQVTILARRPEVAKARVQTTGITAQVIGMYDVQDEIKGGLDLLVIAAPMSAQAIEPLVKRTGAHLVVDLRGESVTDPLVEGSFKMIPLPQVFADFVKGQEEREECRRQAQSLVDECVAGLIQTQVVRPFGWDDLCA